MQDHNRFNEINLTEHNGISKIKIDTVELKGLQSYEIKRDTDLVELTINIIVPKNFFNTDKEK